MVITKRKSKHNRMTMTEGKFYLNLLDFISNGKCCRWTAAPTELPWLHLAICVESTGWSIQVIRATCAEQKDVMKFDEEVIFISIFPVIRTVRPRTKWRITFQPVISFSALKCVLGKSWPVCATDNYLNLVLKTKERMKIHFHSSINFRSILYSKTRGKF